MHLVEGLDNIKGIPKGAFAIVAKYHHAAIDGATGAEIVSGLHSTTPEHDPNPEPEPWEPEPQPSWIGLMARAAVNNIREPFQLAKATAATTFANRFSSQKQQRRHCPRSANHF
jgi:hypothetical protein